MENTITVILKRFKYLDLAFAYTLNGSLNHVGQYWNPNHEISLGQGSKLQLLAPYLW